jgi:mono/diheme cytochrome c family protein
MGSEQQSTTDVSKNRYVQRLRVLLLLSSLTTIVFLLLAAYEENFTGTWRGDQKTYRAAVIARAKTEQARRAAGNMEIGVKQIFLPELARIDRCITCHIGIDDPAQAAAPQPLRSHGGQTLRQHPSDRFGCTVCHDGQGRATEREAAHGNVPYWPEPWLQGDLIYTSCGRCHYENDLFGAEFDMYANEGPPQPIDQSELTWTVPGASSPNDYAVGRGKQLVLTSGCLGCHHYRGRGGEIGRDITYVGDKTTHDFDFQNVQGEHTVEHWLFEHFKSPGAVTPDTLMPNMNFTDQEAKDLSIYMLSLHRKHMPATHTPVPPRRSGQPVTAPQLYTMFCTACHGKDGQGVKFFDERNTPVPALRFTAERLGLYEPDHAKIAIELLQKKADLAALSANPPIDAPLFEDFVKRLATLRDVMRNGRPGTKKDPNSPLAPVSMPGWRETFTDDQIDAILIYLIGLYPWDKG